MDRTSCIDIDISLESMRATMDLSPDVSGVLNDNLLGQAVENSYIDAGQYKIRESQIQPASLDLTLGQKAHRLRSSFLPGKDRVASKLEELSQGAIDLRQEGGFLEHRVPYLVELRERLRLPEWLRAKANPKSSTGRLDVFTRLITDNSHQFDEVRPGYKGTLYLEIVPISFPIKVQEGTSLNQLRVIAGDSIRLNDVAIREAHIQDPLLYFEDQPITTERLALSNGLFLSVDLHGSNGVVGYKARSHTRLLDLTTDRPLNTEDFWEPVQSERGGQVVLEPEAFYLLLSRERVSIPPHLASEMVAYDTTSGELRTHYAGFFDPGFGYQADRPGTRAALEVRAHDVPFIVEHGQNLCKLSFETMAEQPRRPYGDELGSHYQRQETTLSKYFLQQQLLLDVLHGYERAR